MQIINFGIEKWTIAMLWLFLHALMYFSVLRIQSSEKVAETHRSALNSGYDCRKLSNCMESPRFMGSISFNTTLCRRRVDR